jgi:tetratricopeptide (TPR) repeat protein
MRRSSLVPLLILAISCAAHGSILSTKALSAQEAKQDANSQKPEDPPKPADSTKPPEPPPAPEPPKPTGLLLARLLPGIGAVNHPITTSSLECQQFYSQGLAFQHSFVYMEAVRSFERATQIDPRCPMAFWGLSRALEMWGRADEAKKALAWAKALSANASDREQKLIDARVLEREAAPLKDKERENKMNQARRALDEVLALHPDEEEAWMQRAAIADGGSMGAIPFYKACLQVNPRHPGAHHQLVHAYEGIGRPALGWPHSDGYIDSAPLVPHSHHMQVHLAMRLSRWDVASANMLRSITLEKLYHQEMRVDPKQDAQYQHHMDICVRALVHTGNYARACELKREADACGWQMWNTWSRLLQAQHDWVELLKLGEEAKKKNSKDNGPYLCALACLGAGDLDRAKAETEALQKELESKKGNRDLEYKLAELGGRLDCLTGRVAEGLKRIREWAEKSKSDYGYHAYGGGAYLLEVWGQTALECGQLEDAEEGFLEALAHDTHSAVAAIGLRVICERQNRQDEATRYTELARRCWKDADSGVYDRELARIASLRLPAAPPTTATTATSFSNQ